MMNCNKCGNELQETDKLAWKCNSCGKAYGVKLSYLQKIQEKKNPNGVASLLKCKECGKPLDNGDEKIFWKCSCGNVQSGRLKEYGGKVNRIEKSNLIKCPDCGHEVSRRAEKCPNCGCPIKSDNCGERVIKKKKSKKRHLKKMCITLIALVGIVIAGTLVFYFWKSREKEQKEVIANQQEETVQESRDTEDKKILDKAFSQLSDMNDKTERIGQDVLDNWNTTGTSYVFNGCFDRDGDYYSVSQGKIISSHWNFIDTVADYKVSVKQLLTSTNTVIYQEYKESLENLYSSICSFYSFVIKFPEGMNEITYTNTFNGYRNKCNENLSKAELKK